MRNVGQTEREVRDSNMELLRLVAMGMVLCVHANFAALGTPTASVIAAHPVETYARMVWESLCIVSVNVFVLLSGWYGIRVRAERMGGLVFQVLFISLVLYVGARAAGQIEAWDARDWVRWLTCQRNGGLWFVNAYVVLWVCAPVLNAYIERATQKELGVFLTAFYVLQTLWGTVVERNAPGWYMQGYSPVSFGGLYLLAGYVRRYCTRWMQGRKLWDMLGYAGISLAAATGAWLTLRVTGDKDLMKAIFYAYDSPVVVGAAVCVVVFFAKIKLESKAVNAVAVSAFAVYLVHCDPIVFKRYLGTVRAWYETENTGAFVLLTAGLMAALFAGAIMIDRVRMRVWEIVLGGIKKIFPRKGMRGKISQRKSATRRRSDTDSESMRKNSVVERRR